MSVLKRLQFTLKHVSLCTHLGKRSNQFSSRVSVLGFLVHSSSIKANLSVVDGSQQEFINLLLNEEVYMENNLCFVVPSTPVTGIVASHNINNEFIEQEVVLYGLFFMDPLVKSILMCN